MGIVDTDRWLDFFTPYFESQSAARFFVEALEVLPLGDARHPAKIMMHQTQRLISLANDLPNIRPHNEGLRLLFLLICAENIAKLANRFEDEGQSKHYVRSFFNWFVSGPDKDTLLTGITRHDHTPLTLETLVDSLYSVRCDVVHEGRYWGFHFHDGDTAILNSNPDVVVSIKLSDFRDIVVRGCICAINRYPRPPGDV